MDLNVAFNNKNYQSIVDHFSSLSSTAEIGPSEKHIIAVSHYYLGDYATALSLCESIYPFMNGDEAFLAFMDQHFVNLGIQIPHLLFTRIHFPWYQTAFC